MDRRPQQPWTATNCKFDSMCNIERCSLNHGDRLPKICFLRENCMRQNCAYVHDWEMRNPQLVKQDDTSQWRRQECEWRQEREQQSQPSPRRNFRTNQAAPRRALMNQQPAGGYQNAQRALMNQQPAGGYQNAPGNYGSNQSLLTNTLALRSTPQLQLESSANQSSRISTQLYEKLKAIVMSIRTRENRGPLCFTSYYRLRDTCNRIMGHSNTWIHAKWIVNAQICPDMLKDQGCPRAYTEMGCPFSHDPKKLPNQGNF
jgi:hypothetical protein